MADKFAQEELSAIDFQAGRDDAKRGIPASESQHIATYPLVYDAGRVAGSKAARRKDEETEED